jgi:hypothetical protein
MKEFKYTFAVARGIVFEVNYYTLGSNKSAHFSTSAGQFNRPRTDYNQCGQAQDSLLTGKARTFWKKWDKHHLKDLSPATHAELLKDIEQLKRDYPHFVEGDRFSDAVAAERAFRGVKLA